MAQLATTDVFVIGGGPAGLSAAMAARQRGFDVMVADCAVPPLDKACGEGIMPDGVAAAAAIGLNLEHAGVRFGGIRFREDAIGVEARFPAGHGIGLRRTALHGMMAEQAAAAGARLVWGAHVEGISPEGVRVDGKLVQARWIVGADGGRSIVRRWAELEKFARETRRYGYRRHYRIAPQDDFMELHWTDGCQLYITPTAADETCVALISRDPRLRLDDALPLFPEVARRFAGVPHSTGERGSITAMRRLERVCAENVALVGDASGSVDAVTGEGLCLLFQQASALADAMAAGDLAQYQAAHRRIGRRPEWMADLMLLLDRRAGLRRRTLRAMQARPSIFARMLAHHVGKAGPAAMLTNGLALSWQLLIS